VPLLLSEIIPQFSPLSEVFAQLAAHFLKTQCTVNLTIINIIKPEVKIYNNTWRMNLIKLIRTDKNDVLAR
jgi:hypothetical protein